MGSWMFGWTEISRRPYSNLKSIFESKSTCGAYNTTEYLFFSQLNFKKYLWYQNIRAENLLLCQKAVRVKVLSGHINFQNKLGIWQGQGTLGGKDTWQQNNHIEFFKNILLIMFYEICLVKIVFRRKVLKNPWSLIAEFPSIWAFVCLHTML